LFPFQLFGTNFAIDTFVHISIILQGISLNQGQLRKQFFSEYLSNSGEPKTS
jgi:hypothetical protein